MQNTLTFLALLFSLHAFATDSIHSAVRRPGETFVQAQSRYWMELSKAQVAREGSASETKKKFEELDLSGVPQYEYLDELFTDLRDEQFLTHADKPDFKRRLSWLYPHDGCWIRAALMKQLSVEWEQEEPHKLFIFGSLNVTTANAVGGKVSWWYHVVPVLRDEAGELVVLDPAINPEKPLPVKEWIVTMVPKVEDAQFSLCKPGTYTPSSPCLQPKGDDDTNAKTQIGTYLNAEWNNLVALNRTPEEELGDNPPW